MPNIEKYYKGKNSLFGDVSVLSFNSNKIITTSEDFEISKNIRLVNKSIFPSSKQEDQAPHYEHSKLSLTTEYQTYVLLKEGKYWIFRQSC